MLVAQKLLQLRAFRVQVRNPFIWANGWKSPVYLDDRKILSYAFSRNFFKLEIARMIAEMYPDADVIAGVAVNALAYGVLAAEQLDLPFISVYPTPKNHGFENQIEGDLRPRQKVVVVENQVSMGRNVSKVIEALRGNGCIVQAVVTLFDFQLPNAKKLFKNEEVPLLALTDFDAFIKVALESNSISENDYAALLEWHKNPQNWNN